MIKPSFYHYCIFELSKIYKFSISASQCIPQVQPSFLSSQFVKVQYFSALLSFNFCTQFAEQEWRAFRARFHWSTGFPSGVLSQHQLIKFLSVLLVLPQASAEDSLFRLPLSPTKIESNHFHLLIIAPTDCYICFSEVNLCSSLFYILSFLGFVFADML